MNTDFHKNLSVCVSNNNVGAATSVIMDELGHMVVHHRADFVDLLVNSDAPADAKMADAALIDLYFENIHKKELLIGTALLVNMHNKVDGFDGVGEVSDLGVKASYRILNTNFIRSRSGAEADAHRYDWKIDGEANTGPKYYSAKGGEEQSQFWGAAIAGGMGLAGKIKDSRHKKKYGALDALTAQQAAKSDITKSIIKERTDQIAATKKAKDQKAKNLKIGLIVGGSLVGLAIVGLLIYKLKK